MYEASTQLWIRISKMNAANVIALSVQKASSAEGGNSRLEWSGSETSGAGVAEKGAG